MKKIFIAFMVVLLFTAMPYENVQAFDSGQSSEYVLIADFDNAGESVVNNLLIPAGWEAVFNVGCSDVNTKYSKTVLIGELLAPEPERTTTLNTTNYNSIATAFNSYSNEPYLNFETYDMPATMQINKASIIGDLFGGDGSGDGWADIVNIVLLVVTAVAGRLWLKFKNKFSAIVGLLSVLNDYMEDDKLSSAESKDIVKRVNDILSKDTQ